MKTVATAIFIALVLLVGIGEALADTYTAYCVNGRIIVDTRDMNQILIQFPMPSNDVYVMMQCNDKNQANN